MTTYTIKKGDTLSKIAKANGTTVAELAKSNKITDPNKIFAGASLNIPNTNNSTDTTERSLATGGLTPEQISAGNAFSSKINAGTTSDKTDNTKSTNNIIDTGNLSSTGNDNLDKIQKSIADMININPAQYNIPANLKITPALTATFLNWAHQAVDPQTQQLIRAEAANINTSLQNTETQYNQNVGQTVQDYGTKLAAQDEASAGTGTAFSGARGLADTNLTNTTNRTLASLGATTAANIGNTLQAGGAQVGSANTNLLNMPTLNNIGVNSANNTGINTTGTNRGNMNYNYNPSIYTAGAIPTSQNTALGNLQSNYLKQYSDLAANNSNGSRSMNDLLGMISGAPANAPTNLM